MRIISVPMHYNPQRDERLVADHVNPALAEAIARFLNRSFCNQSDPRVFVTREETDDAASRETPED